MTGPGADDATQPLDVVAVGNALVDVLAHATDEQVAAAGLVKGSMALVDLERSAAVYEAMEPATEVSGGSAANTAAGLAALGGSVGYIGKVAEDELGEIFRHDLVAAGVVASRQLAPRRPRREAGAFDQAPDAADDVAAFARPETDDAATGRCLVLVTGDGERTMATHLGVASTLDGDDLDEALVERARILYLEGYLWDLDPAKAAMRRAMELAHRADGLVALSLSDPFCVERHRREFLALVAGEVDVLFANEEEAVSLFGVGSLPEALGALEETGLLAVVTRGAEGAMVVTASGPVAVPARPVEHVVDTTGAGDLFAAGFLRGLTTGRDPVECTRLGAVSAAECISHLGARPQADLRRLAADAGLG